jgi:outer membrane protein OmpA-like peptidoglycan-associated protein
LAAVLALSAALGGCQNERRAAAAPLIQAPPDCVDINFPIYFEPRSAAITREAGQLITIAGTRSRGCDVTGIVVVGLADVHGAPGANLELSRRRADAVTHALHRSGFTTVQFRESAVGVAGAETAAGDARPLRRRVEVSIHLMNRPANR